VQSEARDGKKYKPVPAQRYRASPHDHDACSLRALILPLQIARKGEKVDWAEEKIDCCCNFYSKKKNFVLVVAGNAQPYRKMHWTKNSQTDPL
jgi:hypothetical protein